MAERLALWLRLTSPVPENWAGREWSPDPGGGADAYPAQTNASFPRILDNDAVVGYRLDIPDGLAPQQPAWQPEQQLGETLVAAFREPSSDFDGDPGRGRTPKPGPCSKPILHALLSNYTPADVELGALDWDAFLDRGTSEDGLDNSTFWAFDTPWSFFTHCRIANARHHAAHPGDQFHVGNSPTPSVPQIEVSGHDISASNL